VAAARFLQISDLHLGAPFGWLAPERRAERRREQQRALEDAVAEAIHRRVEGILIAGDLFDREGVDAQTLAFAVHVFEAPGCPPVLIAPGNHDPWSLTSPYWNARLLGARGWSWPEHVHVFTSARWSARRLAGSPVEVWGRSFTTGIPSAERPLDPAMLGDASRENGSALRVAVFHGSREGFLPPGQVTAGPFSDEEARRSPFVYLAAGHYHLRSRLDHAGAVRLAYAGSAIAIAPDELGAHGALEVRIDRDRVETEFVELDRRRVHELSVDVSGAASEDQVDRGSRAGCRAACAGAGREPSSRRASSTSASTLEPCGPTTTSNRCGAAPASPRRSASHGPCSSGSRARTTRTGAP